MVRAVGLEPTLLSEPDFESGASTSSTTPASRTGVRPAGWTYTGPVGISTGTGIVRADDLPFGPAWLKPATQLSKA